MIKYSEQDLDFYITLYQFSIEGECLYVVAPFEDIVEIKKYDMRIFDPGDMDPQLFSDIFEKGSISIINSKKDMANDLNADVWKESIPFAIDCYINGSNPPYFYYDQEFTVGELLDQMKE